MRFTVTIEGKEYDIITLLRVIIQQIEEYESKYQQILDIIMEKSE